MKLTDTCPMPFGKHKGEPMQDVPARYFHYLWTNGVKEEKGSVHDYIEESIHALEMDYPDGIW